MSINSFTRLTSVKRTTDDMFSSLVGAEWETSLYTTHVHLLTWRDTGGRHLCTCIDCEIFFCDLHSAGKTDSLIDSSIERSSRQKAISLSTTHS